MILYPKFSCSVIMKVSPVDLLTGTGYLGGKSEKCSGICNS